jgi:hypothetical protein
MSDDAVFSIDGDGASIAIAESALAISSKEASFSSSSPGEPCDSRIFGTGGISGSPCGGDGTVSGWDKEALCFFRSCIAFIKRSFSGVIVGDFGAVLLLGDIGGFIDVPELVVGRPPLVCGLTRIVVCRVDESDPESGGGESVIVGGGLDSCAWAVPFDFFEGLDTNLSPGGKVETGR